MTNAHQIVPNIELGGRLWPIPRLALGQYAIVLPALTACLPQVLSVAEASEAAKSGDDRALVAAMEAVDADVLGAMMTAVYYGMVGGTPNLTIEEFERIPATFMELAAAMTVVMAQIKLIKNPVVSIDAPVAGRA
jgi:hypothetical protein